jgi:hypothetical protein
LTTNDCLFRCRKCGRVLGEIKNGNFISINKGRKITVICEQGSKASVGIACEDRDCNTTNIVKLDKTGT